jgi:hypothetical protein
VIRITALILPTIWISSDLLSMTSG